MDPGAVPGASTTHPGGFGRGVHGGDTGSTRVVKVHLSLGMIPPLSGHFTNANDNHEAFAIAA